jgi:hypothetical protein
VAEPAQGIGSACRSPHDAGAARLSGSERLGGYYSEEGESPVLWIGSGLAGLGAPAGRDASDPMVAELWSVPEGSEVTGDQMKDLFGEGLHPNADRIAERLIGFGIGHRGAIAGAPRLLCATRPVPPRPSNNSATRSSLPLKRITSSARPAGPMCGTPSIGSPPRKVTTESIRKVSTDRRVASKAPSDSAAYCAPEGIRTPNLLIRSQMLYPLSYGRLRVFSCAVDGSTVAEARGFEPPVPFEGDNSLAVSPIRPLWHAS